MVTETNLIETGIDDRSLPSDNAPGYPGGAVAAQLATTVQYILRSCGTSRILEIGASTGALIGALLARGADAHGADAAEIAVARGNRQFPGRFTLGALPRLPYPDGAFHTVVSNGCLEQMEPEDIRAALEEIHRVAARFAFLRITTTASDARPLATAHDRAWWETQCFQAGFRKHPAYYRINNYESLAEEGHCIVIPLEKIPAAAGAAYPLSTLKEARGLHMDMLREVGARSDAHVVRYQWASEYVRPGDRVLDAACGLGYGSHVLKYLSDAATVTAIDGSEYATDYARLNFCTASQGMNAECGFLPETLARFVDGSFDTIISFETLNHVEHPEQLLREFHRLLSPGGRIIVSAPNDWSDDPGENPNPLHRHIYTWNRLQSELSQHFLLESAAQQIASGCKIRARGNAWEHRPRRLREVSLKEATPPDSEWWLMVAMKDPLTSELPYRESVYRYTTPPRNLLAFANDYRNPWLVRSLLEFPFRARNPDLLADVATRVIADPANQYLPDHGAALAVLGYQLLHDTGDTGARIHALLGEIHAFVAREPSSSHLLRWRISLLYLCGQLQKKLGMHIEALASFESVAAMDCTPFSPSLGTKTVDAAYEAGMLCATAGDVERARSFWKSGIREALRLMQCGEEEFIGNIEYPLQFPLIVAVEYLDSATRCVNALRWTEGTHARPLNRLYEASLENWKWALDERWNAIQQMESMIRSRDDTIATQTRLIDDGIASARIMEAMIRQRDQTIADQTALVDERIAAMNIMETMIQERDKAVAAQAAMIDERGRAIAAQTAMIDERERTIVAQAAMIEERAAGMQAMEQIITDYRQQLEALTKGSITACLKALRKARLIR